MAPRHHDGGPDGPSPWIRRFAPLAMPGGTVLDLASGRGRHGRYFRARGHPITFADIDVSGLADLAAASGVEIVAGDLEGAAPWPFAGRQFDVIVVVNYLYRPHFPLYVKALAPGGLLLHETFAHGNERHGRPRKPDFLLRPGELAAEYGERLHVVAYEHGLETAPGPAVRQRIACVDRAPPVAIPPPDAP